MRRTAVAVAVALVLAGCGSTKIVTVTNTVSQTKTTTITVVHHTTSPAVRTVTVTNTITKAVAPTKPIGSTEAGQHWSGNGSTNLGTITITTPSTISWSCPGCSSAAFGMDSFDQTNDTDIAIDSQSTSGTSAVSPGTYPNVSVNGYGDWSIRISTN
jgi:hypothetical protein